jgi:hypothetical protein
MKSIYLFLFLLFTEISLKAQTDSTEIISTRVQSLGEDSTTIVEYKMQYLDPPANLHFPVMQKSENDTIDFKMQYIDPQKKKNSFTWSGKNKH